MRDYLVMLSWLWVGIISRHYRERVLFNFFTNFAFFYSPNLNSSFVVIISASPIVARSDAFNLLCYYCFRICIFLSISELLCTLQLAKAMSTLWNALLSKELISASMIRMGYVWLWYFLLNSIDLKDSAFTVCAFNKTCWVFKRRSICTIKMTTSFRVYYLYMVLYHSLSSFFGNLDSFFHEANNGLFWSIVKGLFWRC